MCMKTNKKTTILPTKKGDISTQRNDISYKRTRILLKSSVFLSRLERWGTNLSFPNVETRNRWEIAPSHADALLMRRTQDANMREVRRLINLLLRIKRYERQMQALEKPDPFHYVSETNEVSSFAPECQ